MTKLEFRQVYTQVLTHDKANGVTCSLYYFYSAETFLKTIVKYI